MIGWLLILVIVVCAVYGAWSLGDRLARYADATQRRRLDARRS